MERTFTINRSAVRQIYEKYKTEVEKQNSELKADNIGEEIALTPLISLTGLEKIIEEIFWQSLRKEEGNHHNSSVELHKIEEGDLLGNLAGNCFFEYNVPISELSKIAPALDGTHCCLLIWCEENDTPKILGFGEMGGLALSINTLAEGEIVVSFPSKFSTLITGSKISFIRRLETFSDVFQDDNLKSSLHSSKWGLLTKIAIKMKKLQHGGTLLIVNEGTKRFEKNDLGFPLLVIDNEKWRDSIEQPIKYAPFLGRYKTPFTSSTLRKLESDWNEEKLTDDVTLFWTERLIELIAQTTSVDGATIINTEFEILGFGAKIKPLNVNKKPFNVIVNEPFENCPEENKLLTNLGGTRHQSAAQFVYDQKDSFAVVASQDGKVSIMFWDKDIEKVRVVQHAEYLFV